MCNGLDCEEIKLCQLQIDALSRAVLNLSSELLRAGMAEYNPFHAEMIACGALGIDLLTKGLGYKLEEVKDWEENDV